MLANADKIKEQLKELLAGYVDGAENVEKFASSIWPEIQTALETAVQFPSPSTAMTVRGLVGAVAMRAAREMSIANANTRKKLQESVVAFALGILAVLI